MTNSDRDALPAKPHLVTLCGKEYRIEVPRKASREIRYILADLVDAVTANANDPAKLFRLSLDNTDRIIDALKLVPSIAEDWEVLEATCNEAELAEAANALLEVVVAPFGVVAKAVAGTVKKIR